MPKYNCTNYEKCKGVIISLLTKQKFCSKCRNAADHKWQRKKFAWGRLKVYLKENFDAEMALQSQLSKEEYKRGRYERMPHIYDGRLWWENGEGRCTSKKFRFNLSICGQGVDQKTQLKHVIDGVSAQMWIRWDQKGGKVRFVSRCTRKYGKRVLFQKNHTILDEAGALVPKVECECRACDVCEDLNEIAASGGILLIEEKMAIFNSTSSEGEGNNEQKT